MRPRLPSSRPLSRRPVAIQTAALQGRAEDSSVPRNNARVDAAAKVKDASHRGRRVQGQAAAAPRSGQQAATKVKAATGRQALGVALAGECARRLRLRWGRSTMATIRLRRGYPLRPFNGTGTFVGNHGKRAGCQGQVREGTDLYAHMDANP